MGSSPASFRRRRVGAGFEQGADLVAVAVVEGAFLDQVGDQPPGRAVEDVLDDLAEQARGGGPAAGRGRPDVAARAVLRARPGPWRASS